MKILSVLLIIAISQSAWGDEAIIGNFNLQLGKSDNSVELNLNCETETSCTLSTTSQWKGNPVQSKKLLSGIHPIENLTYARNALAYAIDQKNRPIKNIEYAETMERLRPFLKQGASINQCWDLNYEYPNFMIACTLSSASPNSLFLFGTLMGNCGEGFCRYIINPLNKIEQE